MLTQTKTIAAELVFSTGAYRGDKQAAFVLADRIVKALVEPVTAEDQLDVVTGALEDTPDYDGSPSDARTDAAGILGACHAGLAPDLWSQIRVPEARMLDEAMTLLRFARDDLAGRGVTHLADQVAAVLSNTRDLCIEVQRAG